MKGQAYKRRLSNAAWPIAALLILLIPVTNPGQTQNQSASRQDDGDESVTGCGLTLPDIVFVQVEVNDKDGIYVSGLRHSDFIVYEDGDRQEIDIFQAEKESDAEIPLVRYTIGYYPTNTKRDGEFRKIRVKVRNGKARKLKVSYDPIGYFAMEY